MLYKAVRDWYHLTTKINFVRDFVRDLETVRAAHSRTPFSGALQDGARMTSSDLLRNKAVRRYQPRIAF
ncbi:hypothetical protein AMTR_s00071p00107650 [Amborella trichopoda]|uniref:Uncharacterized protein n=1 Tax=Amborella trichopoda TaxID=13333 RepID=U5DBM8_AMBTC|nr:hypothetical protein AMTR_s00071p00107650 [Amborella trichopoda]